MGKGPQGKFYDLVLLLLASVQLQHPAADHICLFVSRHYRSTCTVCLCRCLLTLLIQTNQGLVRVDRVTDLTALLAGGCIPLVLYSWSDCERYYLILCIAVEGDEVMFYSQGE